MWSALLNANLNSEGCKIVFKMSLFEKTVKAMGQREASTCENQIVGLILD